MNKELSPRDQEEIFTGDEWVLPTDVKLVDKAASEFRKRLIEAGWDEWLTMPFQEMLINAIVHGNLGIKNKSEVESWQDAALREQREKPTDRKVHVKFYINPEEIEVIIRDDGEGFDWQSMLDPKEELLKSSGKGWAYLHPSMELFDSFEYNEKGNEVTLRKNRN